MRTGVDAFFMTDRRTQNTDLQPMSPNLKFVARRTKGPRFWLTLLTCSLGSCAGEKVRKSPLPLGVEPSRSALAGSVAYRDSIGAFTYYEGLSAMRVRGYGLVIGLGTNGSRNCPRHIYDRLVQSLYKKHRFGSEQVDVHSTSPEALINDPDTAVVIVQGEIPPAAPKGHYFDVLVSALPGTQTKSLRGGRLFGTELEVFQPVSETGVITGQSLAYAAGPVFLNPFSGTDAATESSSLEGTVISGGVVTQDRRIRLVLTAPSYPRARQIEDRINSQFPAEEKTADAISPSYVRLRVPAEFHDDTAHFLGLVRGLFLSRDPQFEGLRAKALAEELTRPGAAHVQIALALEGLGRAALPVLDALYAHRSDAVSFHAAAAGLRLGDHVACDFLVMHADDSSCEFRFQAVSALSRAENLAPAAMALRRLIHDADPRIQIAAYEGLIRRGDAAVQSAPIGGDNFHLDVITTERPNFVYVKRSDGRRLALFGKDFRCAAPALYRSPDGSLTINAGTEDEELTVLRLVVATGAMSPPVSTSMELPELIELLGSDADVGADGEVLGFGVDYGGVARALYHLCQDGSINAKFTLEQPNAAELFGPTARPGRPESEL